jgi:hypothetical protein|tara:strand:+ start:639 stop:1106 length:468 start_codon:yes stop_codon:yes gene_type:complete
LTNEQKLTEFLKNVDDWIEDRHAELADINEEVEGIMQLTSEQVQDLDPQTALSHSFVLFAHAEYIQTLHNKERTVLDFCSNSIWFIVADKMDNYGGQYSKWEVRYHSAVKENPLASELYRLKLSAEARLNRLQSKSENVRRMASVLQDIGKRRGY